MYFTGMENPEIGNVLRISGTEITGSVTDTTSNTAEVRWSDGETSTERAPYTNLEYV